MTTLLVSLILCLEFITATFAVAEDKNKNPCGLLYLTQSPYKMKYIQLNWNFNCTDPPDTILLTSSDITENNEKFTMARPQVLKSFERHHLSPGSRTKGFQESGYSVINVKFPGNWRESHKDPDLHAKCFDYYIASVKNNKVIFSECLSIQPAWMSNFGNLRIGDMMIPGTHNSGAYRGVLPLERRIVLNQDKSFWQQLIYGIRYFDIRIGRYGESPQKIYINHNFVPCTPLLPELQSVANFLKKSPNEVIILNFHMFPVPKSFIRNYHLEVINLTRSVFGDMIFPFNKVSNTKGPQLKDFWSAGQRVIVSYNDENMIQEFSWLWPSVRRFWGNKQKIEDLEAYVKNVISRPISGNPMHVLMAELTAPSNISVITSNLKGMSVAVNRELSDWVKENDFVNNLNIIATDFFNGNDMINMAIQTNFRKLN